MPAQLVWGDQFNRGRYLELFEEEFSEKSDIVGCFSLCTLRLKVLEDILWGVRRKSEVIVIFLCARNANQIHSTNSRPNNIDYVKLKSNLKVNFGIQGLLNVYGE